MSCPCPRSTAKCSRCSASAALFLVATCLALVAVGCSDPSKGQRISGTVTFNGAPVPSGKIYFTPDSSKQNSGMPGFATIKGGSYDTSRRGSQGTNGGPMVVKIEGFDDSGKMIFLHEEKADLPKDAPTTKDFTVPESAAKNVPKAPATQP